MKKKFHDKDVVKHSNTQLIFNTCTVIALVILVLTWASLKGFI